MPVCNISRTNTILCCRYWETTVGFYRDVLELLIHYQTEWLVEFHLAGQSYLSIANAAHPSKALAATALPSHGGFMALPGVIAA